MNARLYEFAPLEEGVRKGRKRTKGERLFSFKENKLTLVATDGRRLAMVDLELEFPRSHEADIIVPTKAVTELQRLLTDDGEVDFTNPRPRQRF